MDQSYDPSNNIYLYLLLKSNNQQSSTVERWPKAKGPGSTPGVGICSCYDDNQYYHRLVFIGLYNQLVFRNKN